MPTVCGLAPTISLVQRTGLADLASSTITLKADDGVSLLADR